MTKSRSAGFGSNLEKSRQRYDNIRPCARLSFWRRTEHGEKRLVAYVAAEGEASPTA